MHACPNRSVISKSDKSAQIALQVGCLNRLQKFSYDNESIREIIGTIVSNLLTEVSIRNEFSSIWLFTTERFLHTLET